MSLQIMNTMKILSVAVIVVASTSAFAKKTKATDFNDIIAENNQAQKSMHSQVKMNMDATQELITSLKLEKVEVVAEESSENINVPTSKNLLKFTKEIQHFEPSKAESDKRLAQELDDLQ